MEREGCPCDGAGAGSEPSGEANPSTVPSSLEADVHTGPQTTDSRALSAVRADLLSAMREGMPDHAAVRACCASCALGGAGNASIGTPASDSSAADAYPFLPERLAESGRAASRVRVDPVGIPWTVPPEDVQRVFRWSDLEISFRSMPPFTRPMIDGGMSGWMPRAEVLPNGGLPPPPPGPGPGPCPCPPPARSPLASPLPEAEADHERRLQQAVAREVERALARAPSASPSSSVVAGALPALGADSPDPRVRELYQRILDRINADAFSARDWVSGGGGGTSTGTATVDVMTIHRLGAALGLM